MPITPDQLDIWRQSPIEHQRLEFKEAKLHFDYRKLCQYCVAIANEGGGFLVLGISDKAPRQVVGTKACANVIGQAQHLFESLGFRVDVEEVYHPDGRVVVFEIPSRPRGTAYHLDGAYLMRSGESLVPMSEDQLRRIFAEGKPDWVEEYTKSSLSAQELVEFLDTQAFFELLKLPYPTERAGVIQHWNKSGLSTALEAGIQSADLGLCCSPSGLMIFPSWSGRRPGWSFTPHRPNWTQDSTKSA
jgi:predicted HTH transcriptional regulator